MPRLKSAKKRVRIEAKRRARNHSIKAETRTFVVKARSAIAINPADPATAEAIHEAIRRLDAAVTKGVIHKNNAARRKSRLMARLHKAEAAQPAAAARSAHP